MELIAIKKTNENGYKSGKPYDIIFGVSRQGYTVHIVGGNPLQDLCYRTLRAFSDDWLVIMDDKEFRELKDREPTVIPKIPNAGKYPVRESEYVLKQELINWITANPKATAQDVLSLLKSYA